MKLWSHQEDDLKALRAEPTYCIGHDVGAGKTAPSMVRAVELLADHPNKTVLWWTEPQLLVQAHEDLTQVCRELLGREPPPCYYLSGFVNSRGREQTMYAGSKGGCIVFINYEFALYCSEWLTSMYRTRRVVAQFHDEAHNLRSFGGFRARSGKRAKIIMQAESAVHHRYLMTGNPMINHRRPEVWALWFMLDKEIFGPNKYAFEQEFYYDVAPPGVKWKKLVLKDHLKTELSRRMYLKMRRLTRAELPVEWTPTEDRVLRVEMPPKVARFYRDLKKDQVATLETGVITRAQAAARTMALLQVAGGFILEDEQNDEEALMRWMETGDIDAPKKQVIHIDSHHKDSMVEYILDEIGDDGASIIFWAHFTHEIEHLFTILTKMRGHKPVRMDGKVTRNESKAAAAAFKAGQAKTLIAHPASAGAGLNFQVAQHSVRYGRSPSLLDYNQSRGRNLRANQLLYDKVLYWEIVVQDSRDEDVYLALRDGIDIIGDVMRDHVHFGDRNLR